MSAPPGPLRLGTLTLDPERGLLLDPAGVPVALRPQAWRLLHTLALAPGRLHSKHELLDAVWPGLVVTEDSLVQAIGDIRQALGPSGRDILRTLPRRGYMLVPEALADPGPADLPEAPSPADAPSLGDRLRRQAAQRFTGRERELHALLPAVARALPPQPLFFVHGPGGIGKSSLLEQLRLLAEPDVEVLWVNGAELLPTPQGVVEGLGAALGLRDWNPSLDTLAARWSVRGRGVLLLDTFEALDPVQGWMRDTLLPALPAQVSVVLAGRRAPDSRWSAHPLWASAMHPVALGMLGSEDCARLAQAHGAPPALCPALALRARGLPLAAVLLATEARHTGALPDNLGEALVQALTRRCLEQAPTPTHREALLACALARRATRDLLAHLFGPDPAEPLFDWLASQGYVSASRDGLRLHDLMRDAVLDDTSWCDRDRFRTLRREVASHLAQRLGPGRGAWETVEDFLFSLRRSPRMKRVFDFTSLASIQAGIAQSSEHGAVRQLAARLMPPGERQHMERWIDHPATDVLVARNEDGEVHGALLILRPEKLHPAEIASDPVLAILSDAIGPILTTGRPDTCNYIARHLIVDGGMSAPNPSQTALTAFCSIYNADPRTGVFVVVAPRLPYVIEMIVQNFDWHILPGCEISSEGTEYLVAARDWQAEPWPAWRNRRLK
jgi:DNA-binding winged helix-turn-helix (wHTH) protein